MGLLREMAAAVNSLVLQLFHSFSFTVNLANNSKMSRLGFLSLAQEKFENFVTVDYVPFSLLSWIACLLFSGNYCSYKPAYLANRTPSKRLQNAPRKKITTT